MCLIYVANNIEDSAYEKMRNMFIEIDKKKSGYINFDDFKEYFMEHEHLNSDEKILEINPDLIITQGLCEVWSISKNKIFKF